MEEAPDAETAGEDYATRFQGPVGQFLLDVQARELLHFTRPWSGGSALDVGGGHGQTIGPLLHHRYDVTVLGSRPESWGMARARYSGRVDFATGSIVRPPFEPASFDVVTSLRMLAHVSLWREMIEGLCAVARHAVVLDFPVASPMQHLGRPFFGLKRMLEKNTRPFRLFSRKEVEDAFAEQGFGRTTLVRQFGLPMALHRTVGSAELSRRTEGWLRASGLTGRYGSPVILLATRAPVILSGDGAQAQGAPGPGVEASDRAELGALRQGSSR